MPPDSFDDEALASAWEQAAVDLGIRVSTRETLGLGDDETTFAALVHDFGSQNGMVVTGRGDYRGVINLAGEAGYGYSVLGATYAAYDRDLYVAMLRDWGWSGAGSPPSWYSA